jgi:hypothetical protein
MRGYRSIARITLCACTAGLSACSSAGTDTSAVSSSLKLPSLSSLSAVTAPAVTPASETPVGSPTEIYSRVAQGAVGCWFGSHGPLKKAYIYHAEADAPSRGGKAEIVVHVRDPSQPNPRGAKAYRINIEPVGDSATLKTENLKMPDPIAAAMTDDVNRWAKGDQGCAGTSTAAGWGAPSVDAGQPAPQQVATGAGKKTKKKTAAK